MVFGLGDVISQRRLIESGEGDQVFKRRAMSHIELDAGHVRDRRLSARAAVRYFDEESEPCGNCDTCMTPPVTLGCDRGRAEAALGGHPSRPRAGAIGQVIDVLRGNDNDRSRASDDESLSVWGVGDDLSESQWKTVIRQVLARGLLESHGDYGVLVVGEVAGPCCAVKRRSRCASTR